MSAAAEDELKVVDPPAPVDGAQPVTAGMATQSDALPARRRLRATENSTLFLLAIALPAIAALTVAICMIANGQPLDGPHFLLGLLTFLAAGEISSPERISAVLRAGPDSWRVRAFIRIVLQWSIAVVVGLAAFQLLAMWATLNDDVLLGVVIAVPLVLWFSELTIDLLTAHSTPDPDKAVIVGMTDIGARWESRLAQDPSLGMQVVAYFDDREESRSTVATTAKRLGKLSDLTPFVRDNGVRTVYITLPISRQSRILDLLRELGDSTVSVYFVPDVYAFNLIQGRVESVNGMALLAVWESPFQGPAALVKRAIDVIVSSIGLALVAIPMVLIAAAIRLTSRGPVIFKQLRYGLNGEDIWIYKFRTMSVVEAGDSQQTYKQVGRNDSRVTPVGRFLRAMSLDELPQLFNVLQGSMSIVGPRPHVREVNEKYRSLIPSYMLRHKVRPGITGLAQVRGYRGGDDLESMTKRVEADLAYLRNWSLGLDLKIIATTFVKVWNDRHAF